ncbi:MAG: hypothetical protein G01um101417_596, partial [Parcubacteria group bacterium Gr01-1014_17]
MSDIIYKELSYELTGLCFQVHRELGRFCRERQYADRLEELLKEANINYQREYEIKEYKADSPKGNRVDFFVDGKVILDTKAKPFLLKEDYIQMQRYLVGAQSKLGLLVNFRNTYLKPARVLNSRHSHLNSQDSHRAQGFSLVELLVYLAVFATALVLIVGTA